MSVVCTNVTRGQSQKLLTYRIVCTSNLTDVFHPWTQVTWTKRTRTSYCHESSKNRNRTEEYFPMATCASGGVTMKHPNRNRNRMRAQSPFLILKCLDKQRSGSCLSGHVKIQTGVCSITTFSNTCSFLSNSLQLDLWMTHSNKRKLMSP